MALKRRTKVNEAFSMASMTDVIFLLLIFFMVTSTVVIPNAIKVTLPQAHSEQEAYHNRTQHYPQIRSCPMQDPVP